MRSFLSFNLIEQTMYLSSPHACYMFSSILSSLISSSAVVTPISYLPIGLMFFSCLPITTYVFLHMRTKCSRPYHPTFFFSCHGLGPLAHTDSELIVKLWFICMFGSASWVPPTQDSTRQHRKHPNWIPACYPSVRVA